MALSQASFANYDQVYVESLVAQAEREKLSDDLRFRRILYVRDGYLTRPSSIVDDPAFFLSPKGATDFKAELSASLRYLLAPGSLTRGEDTWHPRCFFAARYGFLRDRLKIDESKIAPAHCEHLDKFKKFAAYQSVSLVFSSYFADNPGSMFGHTLIRLHRTNDRDNIGLLDDASNFAARVDVMNPLTYPFKGLFGFFRGQSALVPYSEKIQEYNNFESRDLWEYELNLTPEELKQMVLSIWELSYFKIDYFYLDENCSYMMLALLETARPDLQLTTQFHYYAIPSDTVKVLATAPQLIKEIRFKPSGRTRYLERAGQLNSEERKLFLKLIGKFKTTFNKDDFAELIKNCSEDCRVRLIDTLLEYIDFDEKKASISEMRHYGQFRTALLVERSKLKGQTISLRHRPEETRPDLGAPPGFIELNTGWSWDGFNQSELRWRPAHHDLTSTALGSSDQLQIQILDTVFARDDELDRVYLKRFVPIELISLGKNELALNPGSWHFQLGFEADRLDDQIYNRTELEWAYGKAYFDGRFASYAMVNFLGGYSTHPAQRWHYGLGPRLGMYYSFSDNLRLSSFYQYARSWGRLAVDRREAWLRLSYMFSKTREGALEFRTQDSREYLGASVRFFF